MTLDEAGTSMTLLVGVANAQTFIYGLRYSSTGSVQLRAAGFPNG